MLEYVIKLFLIIFTQHTWIVLVLCSQQYWILLNNDSSARVACGGVGVLQATLALTLDTPVHKNSTGMYVVLTLPSSTSTREQFFVAKYTRVDDLQNFY